MYAKSWTNDSTEVQSNVARSGLSSRIHAYYSANKLKVRNISFPLDGYALVAWVYDEPNLPTRYDLWNLKAWKRFSLPTGTAYVKLLRVESSTDIQFLATGANDIDDHISFPYVIDCLRGDTHSQFEEYNEPYYVPLNHPATFGDSKHAAVSDVHVTMDGIQFAFEPIKGQSESFYAGATGIPTVTTHYNRKANQFTIVFEHSQVYWHEAHENNLFVKNFEIRQVGENSEAILSLTKQASYYIADERFITSNNYQPYVTFVFNSEDPKIYPGFYYGE